ncbi:hypothetical protein GLOIN_2v1580400 [Rhizophagus irregularis DAOM 181602=DAOM 197198]|nr:hypothetical protein GLOIN_2v1580400 [Rhizophagus irregularis DAOM 181602=DAOM 197198]
MSVNKIHEFFNREPENWNILTFLEECNISLFKQKIESYLTSLEAINDTQKGPRRERAKNLLEQYKRGPDYAHARDWKKEKKVKPVDGTSPKSTGKRKSIRYRYTESSDEEEHSSDSDYTEKPERIKTGIKKIKVITGKSEL